MAITRRNLLLGAAAATLPTPGWPELIPRPVSEGPSLQQVPKVGLDLAFGPSTAGWCLIMMQDGEIIIFDQRQVRK